MREKKKHEKLQQSNHGFLSGSSGCFSVCPGTIRAVDKCAKEMIVYRDLELVSLKSYLGKPVKIVFIHHNGWSPLTYRVEEAYGKIYNIGLTDMFDKFTGTGENTFEKCACGDFMLKGSKSGSF